MKKLNLSELNVKSKSGKWKTRKRRKPQKFFSEFSSSKFSILSIGPKWKNRKRKSRKKFPGFLTFPSFRHGQLSLKLMSPSNK